jgi:hypothetical protein
MSSTKFEKKHDLTYRFEISRVRDGNFRNLWQLKVQTPTDETMLEMVDADALSTVLEKIGWVFEMDGL